MYLGNASTPLRLAPETPVYLVRTDGVGANTFFAKLADVADELQHLGLRIQSDGIVVYKENEVCNENIESINRMNMNKELNEVPIVSDEIVELARNVSAHAIPDNISLLQGGYSSQAYKVDTEDKPFVLLVEREGAVSSQDYGRGFVMLSLLQNHGYKHAPTPLWLDDNHRVLAISYYDGIASNEFDFAGVDKRRVAINVIDGLLGTADITLQEYEDMAMPLGVKGSPIETTKDGAKTYGTDWLQIVQSACPDRDIVDWLTPRVERSIKMIAETPEQKPVFGHSDPSNPNILIRPDGDFMLIDWGSARFHTAGPEFFVSYATHLTDFMKPFKQILTAHVADRLGIPEKEFHEKVAAYGMSSQVFDVNWAAMMMAKINSGEMSGDINHFREIARQRIALYEYDFGNAV